MSVAAAAAAAGVVAVRGGVIVSTAAARSRFAPSAVALAGTAAAVRLVLGDQATQERHDSGDEARQQDETKKSSHGRDDTTVHARGGRSSPRRAGARRAAARYSDRSEIVAKDIEIRVAVLEVVVAEADLAKPRVEHGDETQHSLVDERTNPVLSACRARPAEHRMRPRARSRSRSPSRPAALRRG